MNATTGPRPCPPEHVPAGAQHACLLGDWLVYTNEYGNLVSFPAPDTEGEAKLVGSIIDLARTKRAA